LVKEIVKDAYADVAVTRVSHIHALAGSLLSEEQRDTIRINPTLTASLVGLLGEEALITPGLVVLGGKIKKP
jgi:hypothetical protein